MKNKLEKSCHQILDLIEEGKNVSDLEFGYTSPPNIYKLNTFSKAKQPYKDN